VELHDDAVTIIDWLRPDEGNYAKTADTFEKLNQQMMKHKGFLIVFVQLRSDGSFFAKDQIDFYSALTASYHYEKDRAGEQDNLNTKFKTTKIRDSRTGKQYLTIPMKYNPDTKMVEERN
ncbi:unnamed protein product, partial [marine sediment metagenome]